LLLSLSALESHPLDTDHVEVRDVTADHLQVGNVAAQAVQDGTAATLRRKLSSASAEPHVGDGIPVKYALNVEDPDAIQAIEVDAGALVAATVDAFTGDEGLLAGMSVSDFTPLEAVDPETVIDNSQTEPTDGEYYYNSLVEGSGFDIDFPGTGYGYIVGQQFTIGEAGVDGWTTPAGLSVATVDDSGGLLSANLVDGGRFSGGGDKVGQYEASAMLNSDPVTESVPDAVPALLLRATASSASKSKVDSASHQTMPTPLVLGVSSVCLFGGVLAALLVVRRYTISATADALPTLDSATALTPNTSL
jgi:hypothetical protein